MDGAAAAVDEVADAVDWAAVNNAAVDGSAVVEAMMVADAVDNAAVDGAVAAVDAAADAVDRAAVNKAAVDGAVVVEAAVEAVVVTVAVAADNDE